MAIDPTEPPLTPDELTGMVNALGLFEEADAQAWSEYLFAETAEQRAAIAETYYETLVGQITGEMSPEILERARNLAENSADTLGRSMLKADLETLGQALSQGIAEGLGPRDIARRLEGVQGLDPQRASSFEKFRADLEQNGDLTDAQIAKREEAEFQRLLSDRRETIARTESAKAVSEGDILEARNSKAKYKVWQTTGDGAVSEECQANEAAGPIPIEDSFPGGVDTVPQHPNCRCAVSFLSSDAQLDGAKERAAARAAKTAEAKTDE
jgi:hypothetical protein